MRQRALAVVLGLAGCAFRMGAASSGDGGSRDGAAGDAGGRSGDAPTGWWNPSYAWRVPLTIANTASTDLATGFQVGFAFDLDGPPCSTSPGQRDAVRVVAGATEQSRVIDELGSGNEWLWFPLTRALDSGATSTGEYWLYCGDPNASAAPNDPSTVFAFYDGFDGTTVNTAVWTVHNTVTESGGLLVCGGGGIGDNGIVTTTLQFPADYAVDYIAVATSTTASNFWAGFQNGTQDVVPWLQWYTNQPTIIAPDYYVTNDNSPWYGTPIALDLVPHLYSVENYGTSSMYRRDDVVYETHTYDNPPPSMIDVRLWNGANTPLVSYDMVRVRQASNPPPTVTVGPAQAQ